MSYLDLLKKIRAELAAKRLGPEQPRLSLAECQHLLDQTLAAVREAYVPGALSLLDADPQLGRRFREAEERLNRLFAVEGGPLEGEFRSALDTYAAVLGECSERMRARRGEL